MSVAVTGIIGFEAIQNAKEADTFITVTVPRFASIAQTLLEFANFFHFVMN